MKNYLERNKLYVKNEEDKLIYKISEYETFSDSSYILIHLELVAGWDYVNPDENDIQGWCSADRFVEDIQSETFPQYFIEESMKEAIEANDYVILDMEEISQNLKKIIDKHNEIN